MIGFVQGFFVSTNIIKPTFQKETEYINDTAYPVHVYFIELQNMYMNSISWHWHSELEVLIVNHGEVEFLADGIVLTLSAGQGVMINQNIMHSIRPSGEDSNCGLYSVQFHPSYLFGSENRTMEEKYILPVTANTEFKTVPLSEENEKEARYLDIINSIIATNLMKKNGYELVTKERLCNLWLLLMEKYHSKKLPPAPKKVRISDEARAKELMLYMEEHYSEKITLDELAERIHVSKSECCRCFKRALHMSPVDYLLKFRIYRAAVLIQEDAPVSRSFADLALHVGFNNASYFNKVFREYIGCTPSEYKKKKKTDPGFSPFHMESL